VAVVLAELLVVAVKAEVLEATEDLLLFHL
jgi:hypothetical protein